MVDDEADLVWTVARHLRRERPDWRVVGFSNPVEAFQEINVDPPDVLITDFRMPGLNGLELAMVARQKAPKLRILMISAFGSAEVKEQVDRLGRIELLEKPFDHRELIQRIDDWLEEDARFSGQLALPLLSDLIQIVALSRQTGALSVVRGHKKGKVWFRNGDVEHCEVGDESGYPAFRELMTWREGEFRIQPEETAPVRSINEPTQHLLLDSLRQIDEQSAEDLSQTADGDPPPLEDGDTASLETPLDRAALQWQRQRSALNLLTRSTVAVISLTERRSLVLHGRRFGHPASASEQALPALVAGATALVASAPSGSVEAVEPGLGWALRWHQERGLGAVYAQPVGGSSQLPGLREQMDAITRILEIPAHA